MNNYIETMEQYITRDSEGKITGYTESSKKEKADDNYNKAVGAWAQKIANVGSKIGDTHSYFTCSLENSVGTVLNFVSLGQYMEQPAPEPEGE